MSPLFDNKDFKTANTDVAPKQCKILGRKSAADFS
jgi:hypothetical protein